MKKKLVRLTESDLHKIVGNSIKRMLMEHRKKNLNENNIGLSDDVFDLYQEIKEAGYGEEVTSRLISIVGEVSFKHILKEIKALYLDTDEEEPFDMSSHFDEQGYYDDDDD